MDKPTTAEKEKVPPGDEIIRDIPFYFFSNEADAQPDKISETKFVENLGSLSGEATEVSALNVREGHDWAIYFELETPPAKKVGSARDNETITGEPGENLVMFAIKPDGEINGCLGKVIEENGKRLVHFNKWHVMSSQNKGEVVAKSGYRLGYGSSLTVNPADIRKTQFVLK